MTLGALAEATALPRATTHRLLSALRTLGYLQYDPGTREYRLGYKLLERGYLVSEQIDLRPVARPHMEQLRDLTRETVSLQIVDGDAGVYVEKLEPLEGFRLWTRVGMRRPLYAGCSMKVLLAHLPPDRVEQILRRGLQRLTPLTIVDPEALRRDLAAIRSQGYSVTFGESHEGVHGVAAPIRDHAGRVVASLSVLGPAARIPRSRIPELIPQVVHAAQSISRDLGYGGDATARRALVRSPVRRQA